MNCDLENSFLLVYLSGPLIITHAAPRLPPLNVLSVLLVIVLSVLLVIALSVLLVIVLSFLLRITASDPFGIFKLFLEH